MVSVTRETSPRCCSKCRVNPRRKGNGRYCSNCHNEYQKGWNKRQAEDARALRDLVTKHATRGLE